MSLDLPSSLSLLCAVPVHLTSPSLPLPPTFSVSLALCYSLLLVDLTNLERVFPTRERKLIRGLDIY